MTWVEIRNHNEWCRNLETEAVKVKATSPLELREMGRMENQNSKESCREQSALKRPTSHRKDGEIWKYLTSYTMFLFYCIFPITIYPPYTLPTFTHPQSPAMLLILRTNLKKFCWELTCARGCIKFIWLKTSQQFCNMDTPWGSRGTKPGGSALLPPSDLSRLPVGPRGQGVTLREQEESE